jgi:hypothetical protein
MLAKPAIVRWLAISAHARRHLRAGRGLHHLLDELGREVAAPREMSVPLLNTSAAAL